MAWAENIAAMAATGRKQDLSSPNQTVPLAPLSKAQSRPTGKSRAVVDEYPRFLRRGDELVKVGWSKSDRKEYHHRAPRRTLDALIAAIKRVGSDGSGFTSDNLNPLKDSETGGVFPTYQVFVALAWLRNLGLVKQHGRKGGYTLITERPFDATVANTWPELPAWRG